MRRILYAISVTLTLSATPGQLETYLSNQVQAMEVLGPMFYETEAFLREIESHLSQTSSEDLAAGGPELLKSIGEVIHNLPALFKVNPTHVEARHVDFQYDFEWLKKSAAVMEGIPKKIYRNLLELMGKFPGKEKSELENISVAKNMLNILLHKWLKVTKTMKKITEEPPQNYHDFKKIVESNAEGKALVSELLEEVLVEVDAAIDVNEALQAAQGKKLKRKKRNIKTKADALVDTDIVSGAIDAVGQSGIENKGTRNENEGEEDLTVEDDEGIIFTPFEPSETQSLERELSGDVAGDRHDQNSQAEKVEATEPVKTKCKKSKKKNGNRKTKTSNFVTEKKAVVERAPMEQDEEGWETVGNKQKKKPSARETKISKVDLSTKGDRSKKVTPVNKSNPGSVIIPVKPVTKPVTKKERPAQVKKVKEHYTSNIPISVKEETNVEKKQMKAEAPIESSDNLQVSEEPVEHLNIAMAESIATQIDSQNVPPTTQSKLRANAIEYTPTRIFRPLEELIAQHLHLMAFSADFGISEMQRYCADLQQNSNGPVMQMAACSIFQKLAFIRRIIADVKQDTQNAMAIADLTPSLVVSASSVPFQPTI